MKIKRGFWGLSFLLIFFLSLSAGCAQSETPLNSTTVTTTSQTADIPTISTADAYNLILKNKGNPDFVIIDVRTADEFSSGYIAGAVNIDYYAADFKANIDKLDKNRQYLIYCRTGIRGAAAVQIMLELGFQKTQNITGGITMWIQDSYPTVK